MYDAKIPLSLPLALRPDHVGLRVADAEAAVRWYVEVLGLAVVRTVPFGALQLVYLAAPGDPGFQIELVAGPGAVADRMTADVGDSLQRAGLHHLCFDVDDVDAAVAALKGRGAAVVAEPAEAPNGCRIAFIVDPFGNFFELSQKSPTASRQQADAVDQSANAGQA